MTLNIIIKFKYTKNEPHKKRSPFKFSSEEIPRHSVDQGLSTSKLTSCILI